MMGTQHEVRAAVISPCTLGDFIHRRNVVTRTYVTPRDKIDESMRDFMKMIIGAGLTPAALPFFAMAEPEAPQVKIQYYLPVRQSRPKLPAGVHFSSYFAVDNMISLCISKDAEQHTSAAYVQLYQFMEAHALEPITPVFQVLGGNRDNQYLFLKVGYRQL